MFALPEPSRETVDGGRDHGHYALPIMAEQQLLGVLTLYLPEGHPHSPQEEAFLKRATDVLSIGLSMRQARAEVEYQARHDPLTGLPNSHLLLERLHQEMAMARRRQTTGAVLFIDLDNFKTFNDALGHASGDALMNQIAQRLAQRVRAGDTVVRRGGDEFLVVLPELGDDRTQAGYEARRVADKLRDGIAEPIYLGGRQLHLTPSIGITLFPQNGETPEAVLQHAEVAMYRAKQAGRDSIRFYAPDMQAAAESRLQLQNDLRHALQAGELMLHLPAPDRQPGAHAGTGGPAALAAWQTRPDRARRIHSRGGRNRPDPAHRPLGSATGLPPDRGLAIRRGGDGQRGGESQRAPVSSGRFRGTGGTYPGRDRR